MKKKIVKRVVSGILTGLLVFGLTACGSESSTGVNVEPVEKGQEQSDDAQVSQEADTTAKEDTASEETTTEELKTVRIGCPGSDSMYTLELANLARAEGYLEEELNKVGYTAEIRGVGAGPQVNEALVGGEFDLVAYGDLPAIIGISSGVDIKVIGITNGAQQFSILATDDSVNTLEDLKGKNVIVTQGTTASYAWSVLLEKHNLSPEDFNIINSTDGASLLASGDADANFTATYVNELYQESGLGHVIEVEEKEDVSTQFLLAGVSSYLDENPEAAEAVIRSLIRAQEKAKEDPKALEAANASETFTTDVYDASKYYNFDESFEYLDPQVDENAVAHLQDVADYMYEAGFITTDLNVSDYVDTSFYERAIQE